jgi:hypothetical protein
MISKKTHTPLEVNVPAAADNDVGVPVAVVPGRHADRRLALRRQAGCWHLARLCLRRMRTWRICICTA